MLTLQKLQTKLEEPDLLIDTEYRIAITEVHGQDSPRGQILMQVAYGYSLAHKEWKTLSIWQKIKRIFL